MKARKIRLSIALFVVLLACAASASATIPSGIIPPACQSIADHANLLLPCYLNDTSDVNIGNSISWCFPIGSPSCVGSTWYVWPQSAKDALTLAFVRTVDWYNNGMTSYAGSLPPDPPPNPNQLAYSIGKTIEPDLDPNDAFAIYIGHVAIDLAAEIYKWVPWGLHDYDSNALAMAALLDPAYSFGINATSGLNFPVPWDATPGNAINTFKFLKTNNLIGTTRLDTIGRVLDWARQNLWHSNGAFTPQNFFYNWQYWGYPPVSRVIAGTPDLDPSTPALASPPHHWTAGCWGTSAFLVWVLRAVNIPVEQVSAGEHATPFFVSENLYLSHGDDPYNAASKAGYPATYLLVSDDDFRAWFPPGNITYANHNVGRRPIDLAVQYPTSNWVLYRYCDDLTNNRDHASGRVYNETFNTIYTVNELEILGLWDLLAQAYNTLGCPLTPY